MTPHVLTIRNATILAPILAPILDPILARRGVQSAPMWRRLIACAILAGCGDELAPTELVACGHLEDGHWDTRLVTPGAAGLSPSVEAIARMPDGSVIAAGRFSGMSGIAVQNIARWDGTRWSPLAEGLPGQVRSITVDDAGQLWAVGDMFGIDPFEGPGNTASYLARWSGEQWSYVVREVYTINGVTPVDGGIAVYGNFFGSLELPAATVAILRDGEWKSTGLLSGGTVVTALRDGAGLCASGNLQTDNQFLFGVHCWDGSTWTQLGDTPLDGVSALARGADGRWYGGGFVHLFEDGTDRYGIARLDDDGAWRSLDGGVIASEPGVFGAFQPEVTSISVDGDDLVIAGRFGWVGEPKRRAYHLARWSPEHGWSAMTPPSDLFGRISTVLTDGEHTYVGGHFQRIGLQPGAGIASVNGGTVHSIPATTLAVTRLGAISDMITLPDGLLLVGRFKDVRDASDASGGDVSQATHGLVQFDGEWGRPIEGVPVGGSMTAVALDGGYAVRAGDQLYRRYAQSRWHRVTSEPVEGPLVADGNGTMFFVVPTVPQSTIVRATRDDTSFYAVVPGSVVAMAIYDGALVVATTNEALGGQSLYRRRDDEWELIGAWADYTYSLVTSPALGLVAGTSGGTRVWNGREWRTVSRATVYDMAACSDGVVAAIDEGGGTRLAFMGDSNGAWTYYGEPRGGQWWQIAPTARGIYIGSAYGDTSGVSIDSPLGFARWTTHDDAGW